MTAALEAMQGSLRAQGLPPLPATGRALLDQLAGDGKLLDKDGGPIPAGGASKSYTARIDNTPTRVFRVAAAAILEDKGDRWPRRGRVLGS